MTTNEEATVSVIISTLNCGNALNETINSFIAQDYQRKELIIIDGKSHDNTKAIIEKNISNINFSLSEKDSGVYDAWNKAINNSNGKWLLFLGAGDRFYATNTISNLMLKVTDDSINFVSGKIYIEDENGAFIESLGKSWNKNKLINNIHIGHPGALHRRDLFEKYGVFNKKYKICGDYEFLMRVRDFIVSSFYNEYVVKMDNAGISNKKPFVTIFESARAMSEMWRFGFFLAVRYIFISTIKHLIKQELIKYNFGKRLIERYREFR